MQEQEADGAAQEVQDAGALHADGEEGVEDGQHQQEHPGAVAQGQDGEQEPRADNRHVPQLPQPQLCLCLQVVRVDKYKEHLQTLRDRHKCDGLHEKQVTLVEYFSSFFGTEILNMLSAGQQVFLSFNQEIVVARMIEYSEFEIAASQILCNRLHLCIG